MVKLSTSPNHSFSMHNPHTSVRCPDRNFFLVLHGMIYPLMIIPLVDTWSKGEFRNIFKIPSPSWLRRNLCRCRFFDDIFKEDEGAPLSCGGRASLMKASSCPPSASRSSLKENFPSTFSWDAVAFLGMLQQRVESTLAVALKSVRTIFPVFLQSPVLILKCGTFFFNC